MITNKNKLIEQERITNRRKFPNGDYLALFVRPDEKKSIIIEEWVEEFNHKEFSAIYLTLKRAKWLRIVLDDVLDWGKC
jgi:hypothetical protein